MRARMTSSQSPCPRSRGRGPRSHRSPRQCPEPDPARRPAFAYWNGAASTVLEISPPNPGESPTHLGGSPLLLENCPTNRGAAPTDLGGSPTHLGNCPTNCGAAPPDLGESPTHL